MPRYRFVRDTGGTLMTSLNAYWRLQEASGSRSDYTSNAETLTDNNTVTRNPGPLAIPGIQSDAAQFTSANSEYFSRADDTILSTGNIDYSFCGWFYLDSLPGLGLYYSLISKWVPAGEREYELFALDLVNVTKFYWDVRSTDNLSTGEAVDGTSLSAATWYFVVVYHDSVAGKVAISVNGGAFTIVADAGGRDSTAAFQMGAENAAQFLNGKAAEVGFWKKVLSVTEVADLWSGGAGNTLVEDLDYTSMVEVS